MWHNRHCIHVKACLLLAGFFVSGICQATDFSKLGLMPLCAKVRAGNASALEELVKRGVYPVSEIAHIARREVFVGMTEGSALCATGPGESVNTTHTSAGIKLQVVFPDGHKIRYLYVENGRVIAWQE